MRLLETLGGVVLGMVLAVASFPWVLYSIGRAMVGDDVGADAAMDTCPLVRWWEWMEGRRDVRV